MVIGRAFNKYGPIVTSKVACEHAIGASRHPCDEVHRASRRAAALREEGVVGSDESLIALRTEGKCAQSLDCFDTTVLVMSQCHVLECRGGWTVGVTGHEMVDSY